MSSSKYYVSLIAE